MQPCEQTCGISKITSKDCAKTMLQGLSSEAKLTWLIDVAKLSPGSRTNVPMLRFGGGSETGQSESTKGEDHYLTTIVLGKELVK